MLFRLLGLLLAQPKEVLHLHLVDELLLRVLLQV
jgi:hypothetical protein